MTTKPKKAPTVPVDDRDLIDVADNAWERDDSTDRFRALLQQDKPAQAAFDTALADIHDHQATLAEVRQAKSLTQTTIATLLEMDQSEVSRLERRSDMLLSTLRSFIQAAGGDLELIATFPESTPISLLIGSEQPQRTENPMAHHERTSKKTAQAASKTLRSKSASRAAKSSAGSALAQTGNKKTSGKRAASAAGKTLRSKTASKAAKSSAASTLTQRSGKKHK